MVDKVSQGQANYDHFDSPEHNTDQPYLGYSRTQSRRGLGMCQSLFQDCNYRTLISFTYSHTILYFADAIDVDLMDRLSRNNFSSKQDVLINTQLTLIILTGNNQATIK